MIDASPLTPVHGAGRCAIRGSCGGSSPFAPSVPCVDNSKADEIESSLLYDICKFNGPVCCTPQQLEDLENNLSTPKVLLSSCPACLESFTQFFCNMICSPNQAQFINVTSSIDDSVDSIDLFVSQETSQRFYDNCNGVKFNGGSVMDIIGGSAKTPNEFLGFLGQKKPLIGSPFQIDFPLNSTIEELEIPLQDCSSTDPTWHCACTDCDDSCPVLPDISQSQCQIGQLNCFSFIISLLYLVFILLIFAYKLFYRKGIDKRRSMISLRRENTISSSRIDEEEFSINPDISHIYTPLKTYKLNSILYRAFYKLGYICSTHPVAVIALSVLLTTIFSLGWLNFEIETSPEKLWVSPTSDAAKGKAFYDDKFGPFYRTEQIYISKNNESVLSYSMLQKLFALEKDIWALESNEGTKLTDICYAPTGECIIQSITGYFDYDFASIDENDWQTQINNCARQPVDCLPPSNQPLKPNMILAGFNDTDFATSKATISTFVITNHNEEEKVSKAIEWEEKLRDLLLDAQSNFAQDELDLSFSVEISLEEELNKSANTDIKIIAISYLVMFLYASLALGGSLFSGWRSFVESRFSLGLVGVLIVMMSISISVGIFSFTGVKITLIIAEVIPFLILAVGVDNIFLISHELARVNVRFVEDSISERISRSFARIGPSILLSACTETVAFALGAAVTMPAVRNFAIYAAGAVFFNALLQSTMFVAVLALDQQRIESSRIDCFPFIKVKLRGLTQSGEGTVTYFMRKYFAPTLLRKKVKGTVVFIFTLIFAISLFRLPSIELGLDQQIALPESSYLVQYFKDFRDYFESGPPVYFITEGADFTSRDWQKAACGRFSGCNEFSLSNILEQERKRSEKSYIADSPASWIDDFFLWLNPSLEKCCLQREDGSFCDTGSISPKCKTCYLDRDPPWNSTMEGLPEGDEFDLYVSAWLAASTNQDCPIAGKAAYSDALYMPEDNSSTTASHFRTSHTALHTQSDFINAYKQARSISEYITNETGIKVYPYSVFYIFFDQYLSIVRLSTILLSMASIAILIIVSIFLGSLSTAAVVTLTVVMTVVDIIGAMSFVGVSLNAISLVNLVICVGISVEFCAHIAKAFMVPSQLLESTRQKSRDDRAWDALSSVGASVFSGITLTKLFGVLVLAFTRSKIFEVYYFRVWLALIISASLHAFIFLPVMLSLFGAKEGYRLDEEDRLDEEWMNDRQARYSEALLADLSDDDSEDIM